MFTLDFEALRDCLLGGGGGVLNCKTTFTKGTTVFFNHTL